MTVFILLDRSDDGYYIIDVFASREALDQDRRSTQAGWGSPVNLVVEEYDVIGGAP